MYYFAYGSNMDKDDLDRWCKEHGYGSIKFTDVIPSKLLGYRLVFNYFSSSRRAGAANIMESKGSVVYGLLIELDENNKEIIREKEGYRYHYYNEIKVNIETLDGNTFSDVFTYKVFKEKESDSFQPPKKEYLELIKRAAEKYNFPDEYRKFLKDIKTKD